MKKAVTKKPVKWTRRKVQATLKAVRASKAPATRYCVIGDKSTWSHAIQRHWFTSEEKAIAHAEGIFARNRLDTAASALFVVAITKVVRPAHAPMIAEDPANYLRTAPDHMNQD